ncbi:MAG: hypothetical protein J6Y25_00945 [Elusimicrobiaceae bacterium]|nr:hypothetical protein [Elusimicrobiaceae bacterium]
MKPFTNSIFIALCAGVLCVACSSKQEPVEAPAQKTSQVEKVVVAAPTAPVVPAQEEKTEEPKPQPAKEEVKPAPANTTKPKTLYPNEVIIQVKNWDKKLEFLKTDFTQTSEYDGVPISKSQGILYYDKAKNLLRLDTTNGDGKIEQTAITDKKQILILDGQGHEITTLSWTEWQQGQPNQALFDFGNYTALLAKHNVALEEKNVLKLTPKEGEEYTLYLTLSEKDYFPTNIKIVSDLMVTEAQLLNAQKNESLPFDTFRQGGLFK